MKLSKRLCALSAAAVMSLSVCAPAFANVMIPANTAKIQMNGKTVESEAVLAGGTTLINAEDVKSIFGVDCKVDGGFATLSVDGKDLKVAIKTSDSDLVSVREVADALGCMLGWDDGAKTVIIVDIDRMAKENGATFDIIGKYMDYSLSLGDSFKTKAEFKGGVEVTDEGITTAIPFDGTTEAVSGKEGERASVKLNMDLSQLKAMVGADQMEGTEKEIFDTTIKAIESSDSNVIYDSENNMFYMNSTMFTLFGSDENTWISMDLNALMDMAGTEGFDMNSLMSLAQSGDIEAYILEALKAMPVNTVNSYSDIAQAYDLIASMLGDKSFTLEDGQYKSNFAMNDDGTELTYTMVLGTEGEKVNSCTVTMKMSADGAAMDMTVASDKDMNSTMSFSMSLADMIKVYMEFKSESEATKEVPNLKVPDGARVVSFNDMLANMMSAELATETAAEATVVAVPETEASGTAA